MVSQCDKKWAGPRIACRRVTLVHVGSISTLRAASAAASAGSRVHTAPARSVVDVVMILVMVIFASGVAFGYWLSREKRDVWERTRYQIKAVESYCLDK